MYKEIKFEEIEHLKDQAILLVTATDIETEILHGQIKPISEEGLLYKVHYTDKTYYIGIFGEYTCFHVQCGTMGSIGVASSIITVRDSINLLAPKVTVMIGIAFGIDPENQEIGDVLVAETIVPYDNKKISKGKTTFRASPVPTSTLLLNKFKNIHGWEYHLESRPAKRIVSPVFSGEELINDIERRKEIEGINELAKGGEMEGAGLYAAANGNTEWILVKGICDFADGKKDVNKDENQRIAMRSATSLCLEVFSSLNSFRHMNLFPTQKDIIISEGIVLDPLTVNKVLFDVYNKDKEPYYLNREKDNELSKNIAYYSIWVSGESGRGKSISLHRNLLNSELEFVPINLSNCLGLAIDDFFYEIYSELMSVLNPERVIEVKKDYQETIRKINSLLSEHFKGKTIFILIDEIPLGNDEKFKAFVQRICSLFISSSLQCVDANIRYALSSIYSPEIHIPEFQNKVRTNLKFFNFDNWSPEECLELINIFERELNIQISDLKKHTIIEQSNGSPRWIKNVIKNAIILGSMSNENIDKAIHQTKSQKIM